MLDFFIALLGGGYYARKYAKEKVQLNASKHEDEIRSLRYQILDERLRASAEEQKEARECVRNGENYEDICRIFHRDFEYVLGSQWQEKLDIPNGYRHDYGDSNFYEEWVTYLLLSEIGKVDWLGLSYDVSTHDKERRKIIFKFCQCIEWHLNKCGALGDERFVFQPGYTNELIFRSLAYSPHRRLWDEEISDEFPSSLDMREMIRMDICVSNRGLGLADNYIKSGEYYEDICKTLKEDLEYMLGNNWKRKLSIPNKAKGDIGTAHIDMVKILLLAAHGKVTSDIFDKEFAERDIFGDRAYRNMRICNCIEQHLHQAGYSNLYFVLRAKNKGSVIVLEYINDLNNTNEKLLKDEFVPSAT